MCKALGYTERVRAEDARAGGAGYPPQRCDAQDTRGSTQSPWWMPRMQPQASGAHTDSDSERPWKPHLPFVFQIGKRVLATKAMSFLRGTASQNAHLLTANPGLFPSPHLRHSSSFTKHRSCISGKVFSSERSWAALSLTGRTRQKQAFTSSLQGVQQLKGKAPALSLHSRCVEGQLGLSFAAVPWPFL